LAINAHVFRDDPNVAAVRPAQLLKSLNKCREIGLRLLHRTLGRLGLLRDLLPNAGLIAALVNPTNPNAESDSKDLLAAAQSIGMTLDVFHASSERDIDAFFATLVQRQASAFLTTSDPLLIVRRQQFVVLRPIIKSPRFMTCATLPMRADS
jgi:ABC-type uncharacterized transport system substrate-binding protein